MLSRLKPWQMAAVLAALCGVAIGILEWRSKSAVRQPAYLLDMLPLNGAVKGYLDVEKLRASGVLEQLVGKTASEDPEYRAFAEQIGMDYRDDLDAMAVSYTGKGIFAAIRGRFNWQKLGDYAVSQKGQCTKGICSMPASRPHQTISFEMIGGGVLGWAVTDEGLGVEQIGVGKGTGQEHGSALPSAVLWIAAPGSAFRDPSGTPPGTRSFLVPLAAAQNASFSLQPAKAEGKFEIRMQAACASPDVATQLTAVLTQTTDVLRTLVVRDKVNPAKGSLSGVLVSGRFEARAANVTGIWPLDQGVIEALISGQVR